MAPLPRSIVVLSLCLLLGIHVPASHGSPLPSTYDGSMCREAFKCGAVSIQYPFYLSNTTREAASYTYYSCGYTGFNLSCQGEGETETPIIQLGNDSYTIKNISYDSRTIVLADTDVLRGGDCPRVRPNVTFDQEWLHATGSDDNLTFFSGCYSRDTIPPDLASDKYQITCAGFDSPPGSGVSFVFTSEDRGVPPEYDLAEHCKEVVVVPILRDFLMQCNRSMLARGYGPLLKQGFELAWSRSTTDQCYLCEASAGGRCAYSQKREFLGCLCSDGKVGNQDCNSSGAASASTSSKFFRTDPSILFPSANLAWRFTGPQIQLHAVLAIPYLAARQFASRIASCPVRARVPAAGACAHCKWYTFDLI